MPEDQENSIFITKKYKRFWYPTKSFFDISIGILILTLCFFNIISLVMALWIAGNFLINSIAFDPIIKLLKATNNLYEHRKQLKSMIMITAIVAALILGGSFGYMFIAKIPYVVQLYSHYIFLNKVSPIFSSLFTLSCGLIATFYNKVSPYLGFRIGFILASLIPLYPPIIVDIVFFCATTSALLTSIIIKQSLRYYFRSTYGQSNADGYNLASTAIKHDEFLKKQANKFNLSQDEFIQLTKHCKEKIYNYKNTFTFFQGIIEDRRTTTNAFKDIYHGLMKEELTTKEIDKIKKLIINSKVPDSYQAKRFKFFWNYVDNIKMIYASEEKYDEKIQEIIHDAGGLDPKLIEYIAKH